MEQCCSHCCFLLALMISLNTFPEAPKQGCALITEFYTAPSSQQMTPQNTQQDLEKFQDWARDLLMEFHPDKCQLLYITNKGKPIFASYNIHGQLLQKAETAKSLGVMLHQKHSWNMHIKTICKKANNTKAFL